MSKSLHVSHPKGRSSCGAKQRGRPRETPSGAPARPVTRRLSEEGVERTSLGARPWTGGDPGKLTAGTHPATLAVASRRCTAIASRRGPGLRHRVSS